MANSLPTNTILSADKFADFRQKAAQLARYTHDFSPEIAVKGTGVTVWYQTSTTASIWDTTNKFASADETVPNSTITVGEPYYKQFYLSPNEQASFGEEFLIKRSGPAVNAVLDEVKKQAQVLLTAGAVPIAATVSASAMAFGAVLSGSNILTNSGSTGPQTLLASTNAYAALITEAKNANYAITSEVLDGQNSFKYALLPSITVVQEPSMTNSALMTPDAVAIALRQTVAMNGYNRNTVVDPVLNITIPLDIIEDPVGGVILGRATISAAVGAGRPGSAVRYVHP